jgi:hypothetical protein
MGKNRPAQSLLLLRLHTSKQSARAIPRHTDMHPPPSPRLTHLNVGPRRKGHNTHGFPGILSSNWLQLPWAP